MSRYVVLKARQMTWLLAALLLCAIQYKHCAYGLNHQFHHKPRLCNFPVLSQPSQYGLIKKNSPRRFWTEHMGSFEMLSDPSRSFHNGCVPWLGTKSVMQFAFPIYAAVPADKGDTNVSRADSKNVDNSVRKVSYGESTKRSLTKAVLWRLVAGLVTLISGLVYSKSITTAISLVGGDFLSKAGFMFVGERLWSRVQWGQGKSGDSSQRRYTIYALTTICGTTVKGSIVKQ